MEKRNTLIISELQFKIYEDFLHYFLPEGLLDYFEPVMTENKTHIREMKKIFVISAAAVLLLSGCVEKIEMCPIPTPPSDQIVIPDSVLLDKVNAIPVSMMSANTSDVNTFHYDIDFGIPAIHIMTENMLEDLVIHYLHVPERLKDYQFKMYLCNTSQGDRSWAIAYFWERYYMWIKKSNRIISSSKVLNLTETQRTYIGYAYAYRAMCYLDLARIYEPKENKYSDVSGVLGLTVPIVDENTTEQQLTNNPRVPRKQLYEFILSDLKNAEELLEGRAYAFNKPSVAAVYGMYARAYLEMGYWDESGTGTDLSAVGANFTAAADYARKAIEAGSFSPLTQEQWENPKTGFNSGSSNNSWIWGLTVPSENFSGVLSRAELSFNAHMSSECRFGYGFLTYPCVSKNLYDNISVKDFRKHSWLDPDMMGFYSYKLAGSAGDQTHNIYNALAYQNIKFRPAQGEVDDYTVGGSADHPLIRVEEMYFIEMEAKAHLNLSEGKQLLNDFMKYRITDGSYDCTSKCQSLKTLLDEILLQKRIEFWGEGILMFDYKRLDKGITRAYSGSNHPELCRYNTTGRSPQWNVVIPRDEWQYNKGIDPAKDNNPDPSGLLVAE